MLKAFSRLIIVGLLALTAYNLWQISQLKREIGSLKTEITALRVESSRKASRDEEESVTTGVRAHTDRAMDAVLRGDLRGAQAELTKSLQLLSKAGRDVGAPPRNALREAQGALQRARASVERILDKATGDKAPVKGGNTQ